MPPKCNLPFTSPGCDDIPATRHSILPITPSSR